MMIHDLILKKLIAPLGNWLIVLLQNDALHQFLVIESILIHDQLGVHPSNRPLTPSVILLPHPSIMQTLT